MAKKKNANEENGIDVDEMYEDIAKDTGGSVLSHLDVTSFYFDCGNLAINYMAAGKCIGGGIPGNRITEAFGPEGSGKSLIASNLLFSCQQKGGWAILLDCENASNAEFMEKISHLNLKRVIRHTPPTLERAFRTIHTTVKAIRDREKKFNIEPKPILVVFDSLTVPPCERELKENNLPMDYNVAEWKRIVGRQEQPGERAKVIGNCLRKLLPLTSEENVTVYVINQTRDKIGVLYGSPETTPGGNSLKFFASLRIRTAAKKKIEHKTLEKFSGINMQVRNVKNRLFRPFAVADDVKLFFENGIDPLSGLLNVLIESERVLMKKGGNYEVVTAYTKDGQEYKFKASKAENRIDKQVVLDCPALIDATSTKEVQDYLDVWSSGMDAYESGEYDEKDLISSDGDVVEELLEELEDDLEEKE